MRNLRAFLSAAAALALSACATSAPATAPSTTADLQHAIAAVDLAELRAAGRAEHTRGEKALARGVELGWLNRDEEALSALEEARDHAPDAQVKAAALWQVLGVEMRRGRFAAAIAAGDAALAANPATANAELKQSLAFVRPLIAEPPTRAVGEASGRVAVKRDAVGLPRAEASVAGKPVSMVLDTGAAFSTIMESEAKRLGLRSVEGDVAVGSTVSKAVASRLAVADELTIGGATFSHVVFIVLPDSGLTFANGGYRIEAILGMPIFLQMKRMEFGRVGGAEELRFGAAAAVAQGPSNLLLASLAPMASAQVEAAGRRANVLMLVDSGADASGLEARFAKAHPEFLAAAVARTGHISGAGGAIVEVKEQRLARVDVRIGAGVRTLTDFSVGDTVREDRDGVIGQDLLKGGFAIDFERGVLELKP